MTKTEFKKAFGSTAESYGFRRIYSCWITESPERIFVLMLQKSNFGNYYDLVIKIFIQGVFGHHYTLDKTHYKMILVTSSYVSRKNTTQHLTWISQSIPIT